MKIRVLFSGIGLIFLSYMSACGSSSTVSSQDTSTHQLTLKIAMTSSASQSNSTSITSNPINLSVSPSAVTVKVFNIYLSQNLDCSSPVNVFQSSEGKDLDITVDPIINVADAPSGTYPCVMLQMSDQIHFSPAATEGECIAGNQYLADVCNNGEKTQDPVTGAVSTCKDNENNQVTLYISSNAICKGNSMISNDPNCGENWSPFLPSRSSGDTEQGIKLNGDILINQDITGTFLIDFTNKIEGGQGNQNGCGIQPPSFGFVTE